MSSTRGHGRTRTKTAMKYDALWRLALALPGVEESTSYGTPAFKVKGKLVARLREDGESLAVRSDFAEREALMAADPETFYITDHYLNYPWVLVRLSKVRAGTLRAALERAWRHVAPKQLVASTTARVRRVRPRAKAG